MMDCGETKICFGLKIACDRNKLNFTICQFGYALKILEEFCIQDRITVSAPVKTPISTPMPSSDLFCSTMYRQAVGSLLYLKICADSNISFLANVVCDTRRNLL